MKNFFVEYFLHRLKERLVKKREKASIYMTESILPKDEVALVEIKLELKGKYKRVAE